MMERRELLTWVDVTKLVDLLLRQFDQEFTAMVMITRGGIIPAGLLAEAIRIQAIYTASVDFPSELQSGTQSSTGKYLAWPKFLQFPEPGNLLDQKVLVVDDVWGSGRTITTVRNRIASEGGNPSTCVLHFNPHRNLFGKSSPDYYAATTDAYIVYPWEVDTGFQPKLLSRLH